jgi:mycothiol synthase
MTPIERPETLAMVWPRSEQPPASIEIPGCSLYFALDQQAFEQVQSEADWTVTENQWRQLLKEIVPGSMVFAQTNSTPVGVACAVSRDDWVELGWVAVATAHRGKGIGAMVCAALTRHLLASGRQRLLGSTHDHRLAALRIYLDLGFHPVYREEKTDRWRAVCAQLGKPYLPRVWGWPSAAGGRTMNDRDSSPRK